MPSESNVSCQSSRSMMTNDADERDDRAENVGEALVVDRLDRLRIVGDAEAGIGRAPRVVILERERLQIGVKIGPQFEQRLEADLHEEIIGEQIDQSPKQLEPDEGEAEQGNVAGASSHGSRERRSSPAGSDRR